LLWSAAHCRDTEAIVAERTVDVDHAHLNNTVELGRPEVKGVTRPTSGVHAFRSAPAKRAWIAVACTLRKDQFNVSGLSGF